MAQQLSMHADRLLPADPGTRAIARRIYGHVRQLPIISPHGHTDPAWFATNAPFNDATRLLLAPDHYIYRMLYSQGIRLEALGIANSLPGGQPARSLAHICHALPFVPGHSHCGLARSCVCRGVRSPGSPLECHGGRLF